ncbi:MAG: protein kinase, partial [Nannocystaceae bacterium]
MSSSVDGLMNDLRPRSDGLDRERIAAAVSGVLFGKAPVVNIGRFVIESRLGVGGMGIVYRGYDPKLDRRVAIKVLDLRRVSANPVMTHERLMGEARALAQLAHPNVVSVHDVEALPDEGDGSRLYLVMEYVEGPTLRAWMKDEHPLAERLELL